MVEGFSTVCKRKGLKVNVNKIKVMMVGKESPECRIMLDDDQLKQISKFKHLYYV